MKNGLAAVTLITIGALLLLINVPGPIATYAGTAPNFISAVLGLILIVVGAALGWLKS